jgi:hypothetical protein
MDAADGEGTARAGELEDRQGRLRGADLRCRDLSYSGQVQQTIGRSLWQARLVRRVIRASGLASLMATPGPNKTVCRHHRPRRFTLHRRTARGTWGRRAALRAPAAYPP